MMGFPAFNPRDFEDDIDFELFVLTRIGTHRVKPAHSGGTYDHRKGAGGTGEGEQRIQLGPAIEGEGPLNAFRESLRLLGFAAAYKVLDLLVEHVLRANGAGSGRLSFKAKHKQVASRPRQLPTPFDVEPGLWDRFTKLYVEFAEARHAATHRRARPGSGGLEIYDDQRGVVDVITEDEVAAFAAAVHGAADLVMGARSDPRQVNIVTWHLNELEIRHGMGKMAATDPHTERRTYQADLESIGGRLRFDVARAGGVIETQNAERSFLWDLELYGPTRVYFGRWEDVPDQNASTCDFDPLMPPDWLTDEIRSDL